MAALVCEFCGGSLITKAGGVCECDSCGMQFDKTWVKEKIQEIRGTVKVEGTVEVTGKVQVDGGTVKVEGGVNIESLLKRGWLALEDKKWNEATEFFDEALNLNAECSDAYLGILCAKCRAVNFKVFLDLVSQGKSTEYICGKCGKKFESEPPANDRCPFCGTRHKIRAKRITDDSDYHKALRFLDDTAKQELQTQVGNAQKQAELKREQKASVRAEQIRIQKKRLAEKERKVEARLEAERRTEEARIKAERKAALESEKSALTAELSILKGLFSGKRRKEIEARLAEIETELKNL